MSGSEPITAFLESYAGRIEKWTGSIHIDIPPDAECRARLAMGLPWIDATAIHPDPDQVQVILRELLADLRSSAASNRVVLDRLIEAVDAGTLSAIAFLRAILDRDGSAIDLFAERLGVPTQVLHFIGVFLARPFFAVAAHGFNPELVEIEKAGATCPACGQEAALAVHMPDGGQRRLWCRYCGVEWPVRRLRCLSCGNTDSATLGYFKLDEEIDRRVDYCEKCRCYVKTIDLRTSSGERSPVRTDLEDLMSGELDATAVREGFVPLTGEGAPTEWRRAGMGSNRKRGGPS